MKRALLLALTLCSASALAELPQLTVRGGWTTQVFAAREFDLVATGDGVPLGRVAASAGLPLGSSFLDLEVAYATGNVEAFAHGNLSARFGLQQLQLEAAWRLPIFPWLQPYLRVGGGLDWVTLTLISEGRLQQQVLTGSGTALAGVELVVRLGPRSTTRLPALVFDLGAGGVLRPSTRFDALAPTGGGEEPLGQGTVALGAMPLSGFTARVQVGLRY